MSRTCQILIVCTLALAGLAPAAPVSAQTCKNFVGGVCLDKEQPPAKKVIKRKEPASPRKQVAPKPAPKPAPAPVPAVTADSCLKLSVRETGLPPGQQATDRGGTMIVLQNTCKRTVKTYISLNTCLNPAPYFTEGSARRNRAVTIKPGRRKSLIVTRGRNHRSADKILRVRHVFSDQKGGYPGYGC